MNYPTIFPHTTSLDSEFVHSDIIFVVDTMPMVSDVRLSINGEEVYFKNSIFDLFQSANIDHTKKIFVFDSYMCFDDFSKEQAVYPNNFLITESKAFLTKFPDWTSVPTVRPTKKLTAMMNKIRPNRQILSTTLANLMSPQDILYSTDECDKIALDEFLRGTDYAIDTSNTLSKRWIGQGDRRTSGFHDDILDPTAYFDQCLYNQLFKDATLSLITEPTFFENGNHLSEKTIMSIYSGHFLIWVGGWKSAETAAKLGLDIFDDIIDHSYQYIEHPGKRCVEAVLRNLDLINDLDRQIVLKEQFYDRLNQNLTLIRNISKLEYMNKTYLNDHKLYDKIKSILR
jgi:hypothetical protein